MGEYMQILEVGSYARCPAQALTAEARSCKGFRQAFYTGSMARQHIG